MIFLQSSVNTLGEAMITRVKYNNIRTGDLKSLQSSITNIR